MSAQTARFVPRTPSFAEAQAFTKWRTEYQTAHPLERAPTYSEYLAYQEMIRDIGAPTGGPASHVGLPATDAALEALIEVRVEQRVKGIQDELETVKVALGKRPFAEPVEEGPADAEDLLPVRKCARGEKLDVPDGSGRILSKKNIEWPDFLKSVRTQLRSAVQRELYQLTGLPKNPFPLDSDDEEEQPVPPPGVTFLELNYMRSVAHPTNVATLGRAARLVWDAEQNEETRTIKSPINYTLKDLEEFAKDTFRHVATKFRARQDLNLAQRLMTHRTSNRRMMRRRALKEKRRQEDVVEEFMDKFPEFSGEMIDEMLATPYMSLEVSDISGSDTARVAHKAKLHEHAGLTPEAIEKGVKVLEKVSLSWRSRKLTNVYKTLDRIAAKRLRTSAPSLQRVNVGRTRSDPAPHGVYAFMVSEAWTKANPNVDIAAKPTPEVVLDGYTSGDCSEA